MARWIGCADGTVSSDAAAGTGDPGRKGLILTGAVAVAVAFMAQMAS